MKKAWDAILRLVNLNSSKELDDGLKMFAKTEFKQDSEFAYQWMKQNPNKVLCYWDVHK